MALRTVFVQFGSNVGAFTSSMTAASAASKTLATATAENTRAELAHQVAIDEVAKAQVNLNLALYGGGASSSVAAAAAKKLAVAQTEEADAAAEAAVANGRLGIAQERSSASSARAMASVGRNLALVGAGLAVVVGESVKFAAEFQSSMNQAAVASEYTRGHIDLMSQAILNLSMVAPVSANELAKGLLTAEQAGFQGSAAMVLLEQSARLVTVAGGDVNTTVKGLTGVLNDYGLSVQDSVSLSNTLTVAWQNGTGSMDDLISAMRTVAPVAQGAHIPFEQVAAALATMSKNGVDFGQAGQSLNRIILGLTSPTGNLRTAVMALTDATHAHGFATAEDAVSTLGLNGVMTGLINLTGGSFEKFQQLYPSIRAARGVLSLMANDGANYNATFKILSSETDTATAAAKAFDQAQNSTANQMKIANNELHAAGIEIGTALLPAFRAVIQMVGGVALWFTQLSSGAKSAVGVFAALTSGLLITTGAVLMLAPAIDLLELSLGPVLLVVLPLVAVLGAIGFELLNAARNSAKTKESVDQLTQAFLHEIQGVEGSANSAIANDIVHMNLAKHLDQYGVTIEGVTEALKGNANAQQQSTLGAQTLTQLQKAFTEQMGLTDQQIQKLGISDSDKAKETVAVHNDVSAALQGNVAAFKDLGTQTATHTKQQQAAYDALGEYAKEQNNVNQATKDAENLAKIATNSQNNMALSLLTTGQAAAGATSEMLKLTDQQKTLQKSVEDFVSTASQLKEATTNSAGYTTGTGVLSDLISDTTQQHSLDLKQSNQNASNTATSIKEHGSLVTQAAKDTASQVAMAMRAASGSGSGATQISNAYKVGAHNIAESNKMVSQSAADRARKTTQANSLEATSYDKTAAVASISLADYTKKLQDTVAKNKSWQDSLTKIAAVGGQDFADKLRAMGKDGVQIVNELAQHLHDQSIPKFKDALNKLQPDAQVSFDAFFNTMNESNTRLAAWEDDLRNLSLKGNTGALVKKFTEMGESGRTALHQALGLTPAKLASANEAAQKSIDYAADTTIQTLDTQLNVLGQIGTDKGNMTMDHLQQALAHYHWSPDQISEVVDNLRTIVPSLSVDDLVNPLTKGMTPKQMNSALAASTEAGKFIPFPAADAARKYAYQADGGIYHFAGGSEKHVAQVAPAGSWRVWAEPETGGEAYIPLASAKRSRSSSILGSVARHFGYGLVKHEDGAMYPPGSSMLGGGSRGGQSGATVVTVQQPQSMQTTYAFNGPIQGYSLEQVKVDADRKRRMASLVGRSRG